MSAAPPAPTGAVTAAAPSRAIAASILASTSGTSLRPSRSSATASGPRIRIAARTHAGTVTQRRRFSIPSTTPSTHCSSVEVLPNGPAIFLRMPPNSVRASAPRTMSVSIHEK